MAEKRKAEGKKGGGSGLVAMVAVFATVTLLAVGAGWYVGSQIRSVTQAQLDDAAEAQGGEKAGKESAHSASDTSGGHGSSGGHGASGDQEVELAANAGHGSVLSIFANPTAVKLDPIVSNIGNSGKEWVRLEIAVIYGADSGAVADAEKSQISEAVIGMLRGKDKTELAGPSGFLQFREDLVDTVMVSTEGRAISAKVLSMVIE